MLDTDCKFKVTVSLSSLLDTRYVEDENPYTGEMEKGVFIPIRQNPAIRISRYGNAYLVMFATPLETPNKGNTHILTPYFGKEYQERKAERGIVRYRFYGAMARLKQFIKR